MAASTELSNCLDILSAPESSLDASLAALLVLPRLLDATDDPKAIQQAWGAISPTMLDQLLRQDPTVSGNTRTVAINVLASFARISRPILLSKKLAERVPLLIPTTLDQPDDATDETLSLLLALCSSSLALRRLSRPTILQRLIDLAVSYPVHTTTIHGILIRCASSLAEQIARKEDGSGGDRARDVVEYTIRHLIKGLSATLLHPKTPPAPEMREHTIVALCNLFSQVDRSILQATLLAEEGDHTADISVCSDNLLALIADTLGTRLEPHVRDSALELTYLSFPYAGSRLFLGDCPGKDSHQAAEKAPEGNRVSAASLSLREGQERLAGFIVQLAALEVRVSLDVVALAHAQGNAPEDRAIRMSRVGLGLLEEIIRAWTIAAEEDDGEDSIGIFSLQAFLRAWKSIEAAMEVAMEFLRDALASPPPPASLIPTIISSLTVLAHWSTGKVELSKMRADLLPLFVPLLELGSTKDTGIVEALCDPLSYLLEDDLLAEESPSIGITAPLSQHVHHLWAQGVRDEELLASITRVTISARGEVGHAGPFLLRNGWELPEV